jgi:hypothetical protein
MDESPKSLLTLFASSILAVVAAFITTRYKLRQQRRIEGEKEKEHVRLKILNPLLVASEDLLDRIADVTRRRTDPDKGRETQRWFREIKERAARDPGAFAFWANDEGYFAMSTLYITAIYLHYAGKIRRDFPYFELEQGSESTLLSHLSVVRASLGGKFGIWEAMQDSLGAYLETEGKVRNYRQFCEMIVSAPDAVWFNRLVDFYRDIHMKLDDHLDNIEHSLAALIAFLQKNLHIVTLQYKLTQQSLDALRARTVPPEMVVRLQALVPQDYMSEVDFVATLVGCIGQDLADDYKPSILKCAEKRSIVM